MHPLNYVPADLITVNGATLSAQASGAFKQMYDAAVNNCTLDCFGSTSQYQWFQQNAANYGFIQRYYAGFEAVTGYKAEEWHYRYVGTAVAKDMQVRGIKTLEQYWNVSGGDYF